ncbi:MAG: M14 family metallopeptidase [Spirochaetia bacterium]|nr:M14 family metallopeptidase [Spirochaetia bacterium]
MVKSLFSKSSKTLKSTGKTGGWFDIHESYFGLDRKLPYLVVYGKKDGPNFIVTSSIHGDELNGIGQIHHVYNSIDPENFRGRMVMLPVANIPAFQIQNRYLPDRRDLNRLFPGNSEGSEGRRLANIIWNTSIKDADFGLDLHSASYNRWNFPHIRGNMRLERVRYMAKSFEAPIVMHSQGVLGSLRREATKRNIPFVLFEAGQINRFETRAFEAGISGIWNLLHALDMISVIPEQVHKKKGAHKYYKRSTWMRASCGGLFYALVKPGDVIRKGQTLGKIYSLLGELKDEIKAEISGRILGFNLHPQVMPGRALFHICYEKYPL